MVHDSDSDSDQEPRFSKTAAELKFIGPIIPSQLQSEIDKSEAPTSPQLSPNLLKTNIEELQSFGPKLPPHLLNKAAPLAENKTAALSETKEARTIGPALPPHLKKQFENQDYSIGGSEKSEEDDDDDESYGPLPPGMSKNSAVHTALEERALQMRIDNLEPDKQEPTRESWMIELPEAKAATFGLGPRQFRKKAAPDMSDRSAWTDIPGEKGEDKKKEEKKVDLKAEAERRELEKRDNEFDLLSKKHKRKSDKSLVELHQAKIKKNNNEGASSSRERRPFNRDLDLQVNKFDEAQKKAVLKKAQLLDDRFSSGKAKYL
ncbi:GPALPP motifs-containing protein 1 isoform X1 [Euwallacea similis]|uniref:GPALPP motifs-containing protein 1 isoform X1 n=1 Tax=Euwallacea similis TaxID=1736056 RepID=UPI00344D049E